MQQLAVKANFLFNDLLVKSSITNLSRLVQESKTLAAEATVTYSNIAKVLYIKTTAVITITITKAEEEITLNIKDSLLLTDAIDSVVLENPSELSAVEVLVVYS